jgi:DNA-binding phage protein
MRIVLHIGMPKTGSTMLQNCLRTSRAALARRGVLYPENPPGCPFNNHRILIFGFLGFDDLPRHVRKHARYTAASMGADHAGFLAHVRNQIEAARPACTVLSSETLYRRLRPAGQDSLRGAMAALGAESGAVRIAVYLRRPSEYYLSALQQHLKSAHSITPPRVGSPLGVIESYAAAFGTGALAPCVYDRRLLKDGDIVADFLAAHLPEAGIDSGELTRPAHGNESVSGEAMDILRAFRLAFHPDTDDMPSRDSAALLRTLRRIDAALGAPRPRLRPEIAEMIDYARTDALHLRDRFDLDFPGLDYDRLARARGAVARLRARLHGLRRPHRLEEVIVIDPATRRAMLARLATSRWARAESARTEWVAALARE